MSFEKLSTAFNMATKLFSFAVNNESSSESLFKSPSSAEELGAFEKPEMAREDELENLLRQAITGSRDTWLIFLDLLEEMNPELKERLNETHGIENIFYILSRHFQDLIDGPDIVGRFTFHPKLLGTIKQFAQKHNLFKIEYEDVGVNVHINSDYIVIRFRQNKPIIDNRQVSYISMTDGKLFSSILIDPEDHSRGRRHYSDDVVDAYSTEISEIAHNIHKRAIQDKEKITSIFL